MNTNVNSESLYTPLLEPSSSGSNSTATTTGSYAAVNNLAMSIDDSQLVGAQPSSSGSNATATTTGSSAAVNNLAMSIDDSQLVGAQPSSSTVVDVEVKLAEKIGHQTGAVGVVKRRRGRPPRAQTAAAKMAVAQKKEDEEDVCFICFDGGSLVLCDRRGCPKAYHPTCIKRDESFFRSKAKWNCGWHLCNSCQKASHYMCFTCPYSLCKGCTRDADYVCVRGNKGFCGICMRTVMLIENIAQGSQEMAPVDFDDKSSWEYLFKVYWLYLKEKDSLTIDEITRAKNPWKDDNIVQKVEYTGDYRNGVYDNCLAAANSKRRKINKQCKLLNHEAAVSMGTVGVAKGMPLPEGSNRQPELFHPEATINVEKRVVDGGVNLPVGAKWASNELLEFVAHMKNGDTSILSQFDVQALLLEYIKRNHLRDPHRKCEILCDSRLSTLFGKARVAHFEMLKLLEYHFLIKENSKADSILRDVKIDVVTAPMDTDMTSNNHVITGSNKRRKSCKKAEDTRPPANFNEYAAIDVHNISLIYLRRNLMENLLDDATKFHDFVVGAFVRIRISDTDQKEEFYRLVQVVGTCKVDESYTVGTRTVNVMLEVLNLEKKERISIDGISNQDFSEEECTRLHQSIEFGLVRRLTVGEIQEKAMALRTVRVNDWLEAELLRLSHLRDRASEKGQRKQLRECVERIELLSSPEERQRRLLEVPEVHADQSMDCHYKYEEDHVALDKRKQGKPGRRRNSDSNKKRRDPMASKKVGGVLNHADPASAIIRDLSNKLAVSSAMSGCSVFPLPTSIEQSFNNSEMDKIWHYQDPAGKIQGPFSMVQLRKWSISGHFPPDLRIWRINEKQDSSILLTDALPGQYNKVPSSLNSSHSLSPNVRTASSNENNSRDNGSTLPKNAIEKDSRSTGISQHLLQTNTGSDHNDQRELVMSDGDLHDAKVTSNNGGNNWDGGQNGGGSCIGKDNKDVKGCQYPMQSDNGPEYNGLNEMVKNNGDENQSTSGNVPIDVGDSNEQQRGSRLQGPDSLKDNSDSPVQPKVCSSVPSPKLSEKSISDASGGVILTPDQNNAIASLFNSDESQTNSGHCSEKQSDSEGYSTQSSGQYWRPPHMISPSEVWDSNPGFPSVANSVETSGQNHEVDFSDLPCATPKPSTGGLSSQCTGDKQPSAGTPAQDSGPSWSGTSNLVGGVAQLAEVAGEWGSYFPHNTKPSAQDKDSCLVSASPLRLEVAGNHAAPPTSGSDQPRHSSPIHPASNPSAWQEIVTDLNEFCPSAEESVSDLLAEVEAMESLNANGPATPTSIMNCGDNLTEGSRDDCFSLGSFSPVPDPGKGDPVSITCDLQLCSQSTVADEPRVVSQSNTIDQQERIGGHSSPRAEVRGDAKCSGVSVNQLEAVSRCPSATTAYWGVSSTETSWTPGPEIIGSRWGPVQVNANITTTVSDQRNGTFAWGYNQGVSQEKLNMSWGPTPANPGIWGNSMRYGGDRSGPRDRSFQGDPDNNRVRPSWNKQTFGNGVGSLRHAPKGQRVCKFYENGGCKKGASCSFLHP